MNSSGPLIRIYAKSKFNPQHLDFAIFPTISDVQHFITNLKEAFLCAISDQEYTRNMITDLIHKIGLSSNNAEECFTSIETFSDISPNLCIISSLALKFGLQPEEAVKEFVSFLRLNVKAIKNFAIIAMFDSQFKFTYKYHLLQEVDMPNSL